MRSKIKVDGKFYKAVKWLIPHDCTGCALESDGCLQANGEDVCADNCEFEGHIFIASGKEALAQYVLARLEKA